MKLKRSLSHPWEVSPQEAIAIQEQLRIWVKIEDDLPAPVETIAGVDVGFQDQRRIACAAVAVLKFPSLKLDAAAQACLPANFPYFPGLLAFRELPAVLKALERLPRLPDLILCDGQGIAHPRRIGIASHLGVLLDHPTIGVAKTCLIGRHDPVPDQRGAWVPLVDRGEVVGAVLRTRQGVKPVYVSPGHRVGLNSAVAWVMACTTRFRLPETTRWADRLSRSGANGCSVRDNNTQEDSAAACNNNRSVWDASGRAGAWDNNKSDDGDDDGGEEVGSNTQGFQNKSAEKNRNKGRRRNRRQG